MLEDRNFSIYYLEELGHGIWVHESKKDMDWKYFDTNYRDRISHHHTTQQETIDVECSAKISFENVQDAEIVLYSLATKARQLIQKLECSEENPDCTDELKAVTKVHTLVQSLVFNGSPSRSFATNYGKFCTIHLRMRLKATMMTVKRGQFLQESKVTITILCRNETLPILDGLCASVCELICVLESWLQI